MDALLPTYKEQKNLTVSQVSFGGFDAKVTAKQLADFLENEVGIIWRCRVKSSWTPPDSFPVFHVPLGGDASWKEDYEGVVPHAFVHFARPDSGKKAMDAAGRNALVLNRRVLRVNMGTESSLLVNRRRTSDPFKFSNVRIEIGNQVSRDEFLVGWKGPDSNSVVDFVIDPFDGRCKILFSKETAFSFKGTRDLALIKCNFKLEFLVRDIDEMRVYEDNAPFVMQFRLISAPAVYYRTADDDIYESVPYNLLDDEDPWIRTTDFTPSNAIGRCNSYRILFSPRFGAKMQRSRAYLRERGIADFRSKHRQVIRDEPNYGVLPDDPFFCIQYKEGIKFSTMFLVNALVHKGIVNQHQLTEEFFSLLRQQSDIINESALLHIWSYKRPIFDAPGRLKLVRDWLLKDRKLLRQPSNETVEVRRLVITPTKAYCLPSEVELSNRVLRNYKEVADRFLRVTFMDEGMQQLNNNVLNYNVAPIVRDITKSSFPQKTTAFRRVNHILTNGFQLCGRKYSFLAFSSNQLRDRSAWFFAEVSNTITVPIIRSWMGKFSNKNVAKCTARMGQCFSSTYATINVPPNEVNPKLEDIVRNTYVFSDGIGKITPDLALEVAEKLQLTDDPPSAYQIRYAGCKGVVAVWQGNGDAIRLSLRPSMNKFMSNHTMLEVVSWTKIQPGFLNRQIITLLSAQQVPDSVFERMQETMIHKLNRMLVDVDVAYEVLTISCAEQGSTAAMMLSAGFRPQTEPHLKAMISCIRSSQLGDLLAKTRIFVSKARWLMGCLDELGVLEQGQCFIQTSSPSLENCFSKHGSRFSAKQKHRQVIVGTVAVAKNPCLHPGDIRILEAVDVPSLHHLADCLVFPQKGDRPHTNEASGSDLDGDLYFVTWDQDLIPPSKKSWIAMDYTPAEDRNLPRQVFPQDIIDFYLKNMVNEQLGVICNAHVVHADLSENGALDENCLKLAELAAIAVDFPKTGKMVNLPPTLKPKCYPDFMGKDDYISYKSEKVLGKLYRKVKDVTDDPNSSETACMVEDLPYDVDLEVAGSSDYLAEAWQNKVVYERHLNALLAQYRVSSEGEVVTGHIWSLPKFNSRKQGELKERLKNAYSSLRKEHRRAFDTMDADFLRLTDAEKGVLYERKASAWYQVTYHPRWVRKSLELNEPDWDLVPARLSFAWIAADYLVRIKIRCGEERRKLNSQRPIDSLVSYLSERID